MKPLSPWKIESVVATTAVATAPINCCKVLTKAFPSESWSVAKVLKLQVIKLLYEIPRPNIKTMCATKSKARLFVGKKTKSKARPRAAKIKPVVIGFLAPIWSKTFPEIGAKTAPIKAPGNINSPATDELNPAET